MVIIVFPCVSSVCDKLHVCARGKRRERHSFLRNWVITSITVHSHVTTDYTRALLKRKTIAAVFYCRCSNYLKC